jgi:hypothetical protein
MKKRIFEEAQLLALPGDELKDRLLDCYQRQRYLKEEKKNDEKIEAHQKYVRMQYGEPLGEIEHDIKLLRRICELKQVNWRTIEWKYLDTLAENKKGVSDE